MIADIFNQGLNSTDICSICLDNLNNINISKYKIEECGHEFHSNCLLNWFKTRNDCPLCRNIPNNYSAPNHSKIKMIINYACRKKADKKQIKR